jgi:asparagine synthase (glutamine-hydrolysing)
VSGIVGILNLDGRPAEHRDLQRMTDLIAYRGPDGSGVWTEGPAGLGHRMLWTTPESLHERLPLSIHDGALEITSDARLDNRGELFSALNLPPSAETTDSELILRSYARWGERCLEKFLGDFAFAIWDRPRRRLFCARDHFGVKPFYYYHAPGRLFVFGSEIKTLFCLPEVPTRLNEARIVDYLQSDSEDTEVTFYRDVMRLPPGHAMVVGAGGFSKWPYWRLEIRGELRLRSDEEYNEAFREVFGEAVRCRLRSAFAVGSELSGGLDSSSVVCVARQILAREGRAPLQTFSAVYDDVPESDERPYVEAVLAQGGLAPHFVRADRLNPLNDIERILWHYDEPFMVPNLCLYWDGLHAVAKQQGVRILLNGNEGDLVVSYGYDRLTELVLRLKLISLAKELAGLHRNSPPAWPIFRKYVARPLTPGALLRLRQDIRAIMALPRAGFRRYTSCIGAIFLRGYRPPRHGPDTEPDWVKSARLSQVTQWRGIVSGFTPYAQEEFDRASAPFSLERRYVFLDRRLVDFCLSIPSGQKLRLGWTRFIMRNALREYLPPKVCWRPGKTSARASFNRGLLAFGREVLDDVIFGDLAVIENYVDCEAFRRSYRRYLAGEGGDDALSIWSVVILAIWLKSSGGARLDGGRFGAGLR